MRKEAPGVWITCSQQLEPVYAKLRNGRAVCTVCGDLFPLDLEGVKDEAEPAKEPEEEELREAS